MSKRSTQLFAALIAAVAAALVCLQPLDTKIAVSKMPDVSLLSQQTLIATAAAPPALIPAKLGGKPGYVLYVTRAEDTVLVRCYPGYQPTIAVRAMGGKPGADTQKEGVMTCKSGG
ncbi:hypothetical protein JOY44_02550 [Phormidium sp. CLA17]|uniref:hypothetical protein n=1 Tax=Leptolyngbya sp. Cla-17 TaxID=2803751 RepID=UPI001491E448|nr:hypothetical protein [Leptolyngbya sp. Cla-17]MBM0740506.1 hypothetical protein [Leptolyngbya sp. Cla-17]